MRLKQAFIGFSALALAAVALWFSFASRPVVETPAAMNETASSGGPPAPDAPATLNAEPAEKPARVSHPPRDAPLATVWAALHAPAQAGDAGAACRLAIETLRCFGLPRLQEALAARRRKPSGELQTLHAFEVSPTRFGRSEAQDERDTETDRAALESWRRQKEERRARCDGSSQERTEQAVELLRAAALAGEPDAQSVYVAGEGWFLFLPGGMASPTFDQWRREAPLVLARMLDAGHPDAPGLLAGAYSHQTWLAGLYDYDLERASTFLILNTRLMGRPEIADQQLRDVAPDVRARARQQADALYARHYAGRSTAKAKFWLGAGIRIVHGGDPNAPAPCEPTPALP